MVPNMQGDIWRIPSDQINDMRYDKVLPGAVVIPHGVQPELHTPYENSADYELRYNQPKSARISSASL
jgi:hypothetical protein